MSVTYTTTLHTNDAGNIDAAQINLNDHECYPQTVNLHYQYKLGTWLVETANTLPQDEEIQSFVRLEAALAFAHKVAAKLATQ